MVSTCSLGGHYLQAADQSSVDDFAGRLRWLYLAVVLSVQMWQMPDYSLAERMPDDLVEQALLNALHRKLAGSGVMFHSDRGSQYASSDFRRTITALGFVQSTIRKGNC